MVCLFTDPVANALNLDPVKYNQTAASSAHIRGRFNPIWTLPQPKVQQNII